MGFLRRLFGAKAKTDENPRCPDVDSLEEGLPEARDLVERYATTIHNLNVEAVERCKQIETLKAKIESLETDLRSEKQNAADLTRKNGVYEACRVAMVVEFDTKLKASYEKNATLRNVVDELNARVQEQNVMLNKGKKRTSSRKK